MEMVPFSCTIYSINDELILKTDCESVDYQGIFQYYFTCHIDSSETRGAVLRLKKVRKFHVGQQEFQERPEQIAASSLQNFFLKIGAGGLSGHASCIGNLEF